MIKEIRFKLLFRDMHVDCITFDELRSYTNLIIEAVYKEHAVQEN